MRNPFKTREMPAPPSGDEFLSVVVVLYKMSRFAPRTLHSLSPLYQRGIAREQYEVIVVENNSDDTLSAAYIKNLPKNFSYTLIESPQPSPVFALNQGIRQARGSIIGALIDGARILSPGALRRAREASRIHPRTIVSTMGWYLGCDAQNEALAHGHSPEREDRLLESIRWPKDGYRLFEISVPDLSCTDGWTAPMRESNAIFMHRATWDELGGYCEDFTSKGGGIANLDLFKRACELSDAHHVLLNDEASFHQSHGGVANNAPPEQLLRNIDLWVEEYRRIRGGTYIAPKQHARMLYGGIRDEAITHYRNALMEPLRARFDDNWKRLAYPKTDVAHPVRGTPLDAGSPPVKELAGLPAYLPRMVVLVQSLFSARRYEEARDVCRMVLSRIGHGKCPQVEQVLASCSNIWIDPQTDPPLRRSLHLSGVGRAHQIMGEHDKAESFLLQALKLNLYNAEARGNLACIRLPGPLYLQHLMNLHRLLRPSIYLEIGVCTGESIQLATAPTLAFGVDPLPRLMGKCQTETRIFPLLSDDFFERHRKENMVPGPVDLGFIDGSHEYMQVVRDFWNLERLCTPASAIVFHDTLPLDEYSSGKQLVPDYWTGDVWKILPFLIKERPDLTVMTVLSPPSGITIVTGLKPTPDVSLEHTLKQARLYDSLTFSDFERDWKSALATLENSDQALERHIRSVLHSASPFATTDA